MPTSFTSYWGSPVHGADITWTHDPSADTPTLTFEYTANYYWRMPVYYNNLITADQTYKNSLGSSDVATFLDNSTGCSGSSDCCADNTGGTVYDFAHAMFSRFIIADPTNSSNFDGFNGKQTMMFKCGDMYYSNGSGSVDPSVWVAWDVTDQSYTDLDSSSATDYATFDSGDQQWTLTETAWDSA